MFWVTIGFLMFVFMQNIVRAFPLIYKRINTNFTNQIEENVHAFKWINRNWDIKEMFYP